MKNLPFFLPVILLSFVLNAYSNIYYVSSVSGLDSNDGSMAAPFASIQKAIDTASSGDEIYVASFDSATPCAYKGSGSLSVITLSPGKSLNIKGGYVYALGSWTAGVIPALVNGEAARRCLFASTEDGDTNHIELLEFANGTADNGGNIYAKKGSLQLVGCPIHNGTATNGGGLYMADVDFSASLGSYSNLALPQMSGMLPIYSNSAAYGGGLYVNGGYPLLTTVGLMDNSASQNGGALYIKGGIPSIVGGEIVNNSAMVNGGGIYLSNSIARVGGMLITNNIAHYGGGIYLDGPFALSAKTATLIANNYIRFNSSVGGKGGGIFLNEANVGIVNNIIANNTATNGSAAYLNGSSPRFFENTIADNMGDTGLYVTHSSGAGRWVVVHTWFGTYSNYIEGIPVPSQPTFTNTIISGTATGLYVEDSGNSLLPNKVDMGYTIWWKNLTANIAGPGSVTHDNDIYSDPLYTGTGMPPADMTPYHIETNSPAVDAGTSISLSLPGTDLLLDIDGQMRPSGSGMDIGADEVVTDPFSVWFVPIAISKTVKPTTTVTNIHNLLNSGTQNDSYKITTDDTIWSSTVSPSFVTLDAQSSTSITVVVQIPVGASDGDTNITTITATSQTDANKTAIALDTTIISTNAGESTVHYVWQSSPSPQEPYATPDTAAHDIQTAVNISRDDDTIFVYPGTYDTGGKPFTGENLTNRVCVTNGVTIEAMSGPDDTTIMGKADPVSTNGPVAVRGVYMQEGAKLIGFTIMDGHTATNQANYSTLEEMGGGIVAINGSTISNCIIKACSSSFHAGGIYANHLVYIFDSIIDGNYAGAYGGGFYIKDWVFIINSTINNNKADSFGGGAFIASASVIEDSTISTNTAISGAGVYMADGGNNFVLQCVIKNNISSSSGGGALCEQSNIIENSLFYNNKTTTGVGGGIYNKGEIKNCTVVDNTASTSSGNHHGSGIYLFTDHSKVYNTVIYYNAGDKNMETYATITNPLCYNNCVIPDPAPGKNNITNAPSFIDISADDYHITSSSPCIDTGTNITLSTNDDLDGNYRPMDGNADGKSILDIGCYEVSNDAGDSDEDGMSDGNEGIADTDPYDANDYFHISAVSNLPTVTVYFKSSTTRNYTLMKRDDLNIGDWIPVSGSGPRAGIGGQDSMTDTNAVSGDFYRMKVETIAD